MLTVKDFQIPQEHPWGMLDGYKNAVQKEAVLRIILEECIKDDKLDKSIDTQHSHFTMVQDSLLTGDFGKGYKLTVKSLGLLYSIYGK